MKKQCVVIDRSDNVATALVPLPAGAEVEADLNGGILRVAVRDDIPFCHKFALYPIKKGQSVIKYGQEIGTALEDIERGGYVHIHNVASARAKSPDGGAE